MPFVEIHMLAGRTQQQKEALLRAVTDAVHESIGAPVPSIRVWIDEIAKTDYMAAGEMPS